MTAVAGVCVPDQRSLGELGGAQRVREAAEFTEGFSAIADELLHLRGLDSEVDD